MPTPRSVELRRHPGERHPGREVVFAANGCCCCCCCCCLHSLGGLIGGVAGTHASLEKLAEGAEVPAEAPPASPGDLFLCQVYWWLLLAVTLAVSLPVAYSVYADSTPAKIG